MKPVSPLLFRAALVFLLAAAFALSDVQLTAQTYYYKHNEPEDTDNWGTMPGGNGPHPPNFTNNGLNFIIESGNTVDLDAIWVLGTGGTVPTLTIQSSAVLRIGTNGVFYNNGVTTVQGGGTLELRGGSLPRGIVLGVNAIIYANTTATLTYTRSRTPTWQELPPTMNGSVVFGGGSPDVFTLSAGSIVMGYVTNAPNSTLNTGGNTLQIGFRGINNGIINVNASGVLAVSNGSRFLNDDALSVQASGTLRLEGTGVIEGDNAVNYVAASNLLYSGSGNRLATQQEFPALMLGNVGMNKTAGSSVSISGARALSAASVLSLTSGTVQTATTGGISVLTIQNPAASAIVGANSTSYIDGPIARALPTNITVDGTTVVFPTGEGTNYRPISLKDIRTNSTLTQVRLWSLTSSTAATYSAPLTGITSNRVWQGVQTSGFGLGQTKIEITDVAVSLSSIVASTTASVFGQYKAGVGATSATVVGMTVTMPFASSLPSAPTALYMAVGAYSAPTTFYYFPNPPYNAGSLSCWWSNPGGTGVNPLNFITNGNQFIIETGKLAPLTSVWTLGTGGTIPLLTIQPSAVLSIGTGGVLYNNGSTTVQAGGRLEIGGTAPSGIALGSNAIVYSSTTAILRYLASRTPTWQELPPTMLGSVWFGSGAASAYTLSAGSVVMGYVTTETLSTLNTGGHTLQIGFHGVNKGTLNLTNGGVMVVRNGSRFRNDGTFSVEALGTLRLGGTGVVEGNYAVDYAIGSNLLYVDSGDRVATPQELPALMTGNLHINKTSGSAIELWGARSLSSASVLTLTSGILRTATADGMSVLTLQNSSPLAISGGSALSFIEGPLVRTVNVGDYLFPVGANAQYLPSVMINAIAAGAEILMQAFNSATSGTVGVGIQSLSATEHWRMDLLTGTFTGGQPSFYRPGTLHTDILATTSASLPVSPLIALPMVLTSTVYGGVSGYALSSNVLPSTTLFPLSNTSFFALGASMQPPVFAGFGSALLLDGIAQYGVIPSGYALGGDFSVEVLVRPESGGALRSILSKFDCTDGGYDLSLDASNRAVLTIFSSCLAGASDTLRSLTPLSNGAWTHLAIARNAVTNRYTIYINGISDAVLLSSRSPGMSASSLFVGAKSGTSDFFAGSLDEIRLWNTNLSTVDNPTEGALVRYRGIEVNSVHPRWSQLAGYWKCNDNGGVSLANSTLGAAVNLIGAPSLVGGSTSCSVVAGVAAPVQWQLPGTKQGGSVTFATIDAMNGGAALGTVSITSSGMVTYTPVPPILTTNITDNFQYRIADGMGTVSTANVFVHFAPASDVLSSQTVEAGAVAFLPSGEVSARGGIAPFSITYTPENVVLPASGDLTTSFSASTTTSLTLTRLLTDRYGLTDAQPITITTVFTPTTLAFSSVSSAGTDGLPPLREFRSGLTDSVTVGVFTSFGFAAPVPNSNLQITIAPLEGGVGQFQIIGNTAFLSAQSQQTINALRIFWLNPPFLGGTTEATLTARIFGAGNVQSTSFTVTVRASALTPEITDVSPIGGIVGTTITIGGVYFGTPLSVRFGSVFASSVTLLSSTQLSVVVPDSAVSAAIVVEFVNGTATSPLSFQIALPPMVDIFEPSIGSTGTTVTINGINFIAPLQVFFGDIAATSFHINSSMEIEAIVGGGMTGKVRVVTLGGTGISDSIFTYWGRPTITGFSPTIVPLGAQVCITGTNFSAEDLLFVGDVPIPVFTFISPTSICFTLDSAISGMVSIVTEVGSANAAEILRYLAPPTITSFSPSVVASNGVVVIRGQNFINVTSVTIGSATFASFHVDSPTQITVRLAGGQQQSTTISVSTPAGTVVSVGQLFIVEPPQIATFAPLLAGRGAFITITGANFTAEPLPRVQFGFAQSDSVIFISSTQISVRVPALAQSGRFILYTPGGAVSSAQSLFVILPPTVTDFDPMRGSTGTTVNIRGTYFYEISAVRFGTATAASFRIESPELIIAQVSRGETGFVSVVGSQGIAKSTEEFEFVRNLALPIITEFTPTSGGRGREVEITGRNVGGAVAVRFGGVEAQFTVISDTRISAIVQGGASGQVQVTTPNGTATSLERFQFISDTIKVVAQTPRQQDSSILVRLYATTTGQQWLRQRAWLSDMPISSWAGVSVEHDRVVGLLLPSNNLRGNLPAFLGQLTDIEVFDMSFNELSGEIPAAITSLPKLRILELNNNQLSGAYPSNFGTTATLQILHLQHNVLTGALNNASTVAVYDSVANTIISSTTAIAATCGLRNLRELNVSDNRLTGAIPPCIGNLAALTMLNVSNNALEDIIPASLGACVNLREIYLSSNMLRGSIAPLFQGATELRVIDVSNNLLTGLPIGLPTGVPAGRIMPVQLETLLLQKNQFSGALPMFLTNVTSLRVLDVSDNSFSGVLPSELRALKRLERFSVANNRLQGVIPSAVGEMDSLRVLNLSNNAFADSVPASIGALRQLERLVLAHNRLTWLPALRSLRLLKELNVAENRLTFEHCEPNVTMPVHIYAPQDSIGVPSTATLRVGQVAEFPLRIGGETNQYQWFRNGVAVALQRARSLRFAAFSRSDTGTYSCRIISSDARLSALKLFSRPIEIRALPPAAPQGTITLLAPMQNAASVQTQNILFSWVALSQASSYEIQIAITPDFATVLQDSVINQAGFIVAKLGYLSRYYWRVRGINEGLSTAWSEVRQFATLGEGDRITLERIDFGGVAVGSVSAPKQILLRNATGEPIVIVGLRIGDGSQNSLSGAANFRISSQPSLLEGGVTALDSTAGYGFVFAPRSPSAASASLTVLYRLASGTVEQSQTFLTAMVGFGSILGAAPLDFDTVVVGKGTERVMALQVTNRGGEEGEILRIEVPEASRLLGFSLNDNIKEYRFKKSGEAVSFLIRCAPQDRGELRGSIMLISNLAGDTIFVPLRAFGRAVSKNDALISLSLYTIPKNAPPGSPILIHLCLDTIRIIDGARIINGNFGDLQRRAQPRLSMRLRMNPQVLVFASDETRPIFTNKDREGYHTYSLPSQVWSVQDSTLITLRAIVVAGSTDSTMLDCVDVAWDNSNALLGAEVIIDTLRDGTFKANVSQAGGKRLIAPAVLPFVVTVKPNPSADAAEVVYLLNKDADVVVEVITIKGEVLQQLIQPKQQAGEHATTLTLRQIPSGSYLVRVRAADEVGQQQFTILR